MGEKKKLKWLFSDSGRKTSAKDLARITLRKRKREALCYSAGVKETEDKGEGGGREGKGEKIFVPKRLGAPSGYRGDRFGNGKMAI